MEIKGTIYKIENVVTGRVLIGQTSRKPSDRWARHLWELKTGRHKNPHFQRSYNKHGRSAFRFEILDESATSFDELNELEIKFISEYKSNIRGVGYNIQEGGKNGPLAPETRAKISKAHKGRKVSPETRARMCAASKGKNLGMKHSPATRAKFSKRNKQLWSNPNYRTKRTQIAKDTQADPEYRLLQARSGGFMGCWLEHPEHGKVWCDNQHSFAAKYGGRSFKQGHVSELIRGKRKTLLGWRVTHS